MTSNNNPGCDFTHRSAVTGRPLKPGPKTDAPSLSTRSTSTTKHLCFFRNIFAAVQHPPQQSQRSERSPPPIRSGASEASGATTARKAQAVTSRGPSRPYTNSNTTSGPKLMSLGLCIEMPVGTCTTKIAGFRFVVGPRCNRTIGSRGSPPKKS